MNAGKWANDVNDTSAHDVQDNGEGYNKVLIQLSAEDKLQIAGWSRTLLFWSTVIHECTNIQKYSEIVIWMVWMRTQRSETWNTKEIRGKEEKCKRKKK